MKKNEEYVQELDVTTLPRRGPSSKFELEEGLKGTVTVKFPYAPFEGIACNMETPGYKAILEAIKQVKGTAKPFSVTGSLPIVKTLQDAGFDLQLVGFGKSAVYHALNEYGSLNDFVDGYKILNLVISSLNSA